MSICTSYQNAEEGGLGGIVVFFRTCAANRQILEFFFDMFFFSYGTLYITLTHVAFFWS